MARPVDPLDAAIAEFGPEAAPRQAQANLDAANDVAPEQAVTAMRNGRTTGTSTAAALGDADVVNDMAVRINRGAILQSSPTVATFAAKSPAHAAAVADDLPALSSLGRAARYFSDLWTGGLGHPSEARANLTAPFLAANQRGLEAKAAGDVALGQGNIWGLLTNRYKQLQAGGEIVASPLTGAINATLGPLGRALGEVYQPPVLAQTTLESVLDPVAPIRSVVGNVGTLLRGEAQRNPFTPLTKEEAGAFYTNAAATALAFVPIGRAGRVRLREVPPGARTSGPPPAPGPGGLWRTDEAGTVIHPDGTPATFATAKEAGLWYHRQAYASGTSQVFEIANADGGGFVVREVSRAEPMPATGSSPVADGVRAEVAVADAEQLATMEEAVAATKTQGRAPELTAEFIDHASPDTRVWLSAETLAQMALDGKEVPAFNISQADMSAAIARGAEVEISLGDYLAHTAGTPLAEELRPLLRMREDGVSVAEAEELNMQHETAAEPALVTPAELLDDPVYMSQFEYYTDVGSFFAKDDLPVVKASAEAFPNNKLYTAQLHALTDAIAHNEAQAAITEAKSFEFDQGEADDEFVTALKADTELKNAEAADIKLMAAELKKQATKLKAAAANAVKGSYLKRLFTSPAAAGMSKKQFDLYSKHAERVQQEVYKKLLARVIENIKRSRTRAWKASYEKHFPAVMNEIMQQPAIAAYHVLKFGSDLPPELSKNNALVDSKGKPLTWYHGSVRTNIGTKENPWHVPEYSANEVISFTSDPNFAVKWISNKGEGQVVYIVHIKAKNPADYRKPEDVAKAAKWIVENRHGEKPGTPYYDTQYKSVYSDLKRGSWSYWETPKMWADLGWDAAHMSENGQGVNISVADGNQVYFKYNPDFVPQNVKLAFSVKKRYSKEIVSNLPAGIFDKTGIDADTLAEQFGIATGEELLDQIASIEVARKADKLSFPRFLKKLFEDETKRRVIEETGLDLTSEDIAREASEAVASPVAEDMLIDELKALADSQGLPFDAQAVADLAAQLYGKMKVQAAIRIRDFERTMMRTGRAAEVALLKGDVPAAFRAKQQQLINHYMLRASHELLKFYGRADRKFSKLARRKTFAGIAQVVLNYIHEVLPQIGYTTRRDPAELAEALGGRSLADFVAELQRSFPAFPDLPQVPALPLRDLTVDQFWDIRNFLTSLEKVGRELQLLRTSAGAERYESVIDDAIAGAPPPNKPPNRRMGQKKNLAERAAAKGRGWDAGHRKVSNIVGWMDNGRNFGAFARVLEYPLETAADTEGRLLRDIVRPIEAAFWKIPAKTRNAFAQKIADHPFVHPDGGPMDIDRGDLMGIAAYVGTRSGMEKLAGGYQTTPMEVLEFLDRHITKEEADLVQLVWDKFSEIAPEVSAVLRQTIGIGLELVPAQPWITPFGTYRGGYLPLRYDSNLDQSAALRAQENAKTAKLDPTMAFFRDAVPNKGFSTKRTNYEGPLFINFGHVADLFADHVKYTAYAPAVSAARRFINDTRVKALVETRMGKEYYDQLNPWLDAQVVDWTVPDRGVIPFEKFARTLRTNMTMAVLGFSWTTGIAQTLGLEASAAVLGDDVVDGHVQLAKGAAQFAQLASNQIAGGTALHNFMFAHSEFMRQRYGQVEPNFQQAMNSTYGMTPQTGRALHLYKQAQRVSMAYIGWVEFSFVSGPTWVAAYNKGVGRFGYDNAQAALYADRMVRKSQGSGRTKDLAAIQRGSEFQRWFYQFMSWYNVQYQLTVEMSRFAKKSGYAEDGAPDEATHRRNYGKLFAYFISIMTLGPMLGAIAGRDGPADLDPATLFKWGLQKMFFGAMRPIFLVGNASSVLDRNIKTRRGKTRMNSFRQMDFSSDPSTRLLETNIRFAQMLGGAREKHPIQVAAGALGTASGFPGAYQIGRSTQYFSDVLRSKEHPANAGEFLAGLAYGPPLKGKH